MNAFDWGGGFSESVHLFISVINQIDAQNFVLQ